MRKFVEFVAEAINTGKSTFVLDKHEFAGLLNTLHGARAPSQIDVPLGEIWAYGMVFKLDRAKRGDA
jgi:hypothetical protein